MNIVSVAASIGGVLSLFLGFTIISVLETIYFLTIRVWFSMVGPKVAEESIPADQGVFISPKRMTVSPMSPSEDRQRTATTATPSYSFRKMS